MANDCITKYYFEGPKQDIRTFAQKLIEWTSTLNQDLQEIMNENALYYAKKMGTTPDFITPEEKPYFMKTFRNIMYNAYPPKIYSFMMDTRGEIIQSNAESLLKDTNNSNPVLYLETNTAWGAFNDIWYSILDSYFPKIKFYYYELEPGCAIFNTNDLERKYFQIDYCVYDRNNTIFKPQKDNAFSPIFMDLSEKEVIDTLRAFFHDSTSPSIDLIKKAKQEYKLSFNKIKYISPKIEKTKLIRQNMPFQELDKSFLLNTSKHYPYLIKMQANGDSNDVDFSLKIFYDNKLFVDDLQIKFNLFDSSAFHISKNAKKIASILQQRFYEIHKQRSTSSIDFCSTDVINNALISIKIKNCHYFITITSPTKIKFGFTFYEKVKIHFKRPDLDEYTYQLPDFTDYLEMQYNHDHKDVEEKQILEKHIYHVISLVIYALLDIPDDDLENITIKEQDFLN